MEVLLYSAFLFKKLKKFNENSKVKTREIELGK